MDKQIDKGNITVLKKYFARHPIHVHIAVLFVCLFLIFALINGSYTYRQTSQLLKMSAQKQLEMVGQDVKSHLKMSYRPVVDTVEFVAQSGIADAQTENKRLAYLPLLASAAKLNGRVSSLYVGYQSGDYLSVRHLNSEHEAFMFQAPSEGRYVVDSVRRENSDRSVLVRRFYDQSLTLIEVLAPELTDFDPRARPWFNVGGQTRAISKPYPFFFVDRIGITVSHLASNGNAVIAADVTLGDIARVLAQREITPSARLLLTDDQHHLLAAHSAALSSPPDLSKQLISANNYADPVIARLGQTEWLSDGPIKIDIAGERWLGQSQSLPFGGYALQLTVAFPKQELLREALEIRHQTQWVSLFLILFSLPLVWFISRAISDPIKRLVQQAKAIESFDFEAKEKIKTRVLEVHELAHSMTLMRQTIHRYNSLVNTLAKEKDFESLIRRVVEATREISQAEFGAVYLMSETKHALSMALAHVQSGDSSEYVSLSPGSADIDLSDTKGHKEIIDVIERRQITLLDAKGFFAELSLAEKESRVINALQTLVCIPLIDRNQMVTGLLLLGSHRVLDEGKGGEGSWQGFLRNLSGFAALSIENRQLIKMQKDLMDAFIKLIAGAIDAKSPYTGGHCQRVPELTKMLAKAACDDVQGKYADFNLTDDEWEELHYAGWLHDCGKVTTPEYVVDKSTKLETIYDRIHEIRMRFEVLKRDAKIAILERCLKGEDRTQLEQELVQKWKDLDDDFAFVAETNLGGEYLAPEKLQRLQAIASTSWLRTMDDRLGVSWEEAKRMEKEPVMDLPVREVLLADKPRHIIEREGGEIIDKSNPWGFDMPAPKYKYNRGELYNLSIVKGTLSDEERYKINDHMIQTIIMLEQLPYPPHLKNVPAIAGGHHEKMDGTGYPKKLKKADMPVTARMMAIADIFEALTASDRPYKQAKTLSEALGIMSFMCRDQHIDKDLFTLFVTSEVYLEYAQAYLVPSQIDQVETDVLLSRINVAEE